MQIPEHLNPGDTIAIVALSSGAIGERQNEIARKQVQDHIRKTFNVNVIFMPNSLKGIGYLAAHPESRAADLIEAFRDDSIKAIWLANGGDDSFRILPYLMTSEFRLLVHNKPKIDWESARHTPIR